LGVVKSQSVCLDDTYSYQTSFNSKSYLFKLCLHNIMGNVYLSEDAIHEKMP